MNDFLLFPTSFYSLNSLRFSVRPLKPTEFPNAFQLRKINRTLSTMETFIMPSKAQKTGLRKNGFSTTFVNFKLSGKDKNDFTEYMQKEAEEIHLDIAEAMSSGVKLSLSENRENGFYLAAATMRDEGNINFDRCITSRSPDWWEALVMCVFKCKLLGYAEDWADMTGDDSWG